MDIDRVVIEFHPIVFQVEDDDGVVFECRSELEAIALVEEIRGIGHGNAHWKRETIGSWKTQAY